MIKVTRGTLLDSKVAIDALGTVYFPVAKSHYWFTKILDQLQRALKREGKASGKHSNQLVKELGTILTEGPNKGKPAIQQTDVETMEKYGDAMDKYMESVIELDIRQLTLTELQAASVTLQGKDQVALMWLFKEE